MFGVVVDRGRVQCAFLENDLLVRVVERQEEVFEHAVADHAIMLDDAPAAHRGEHGIVELRTPIEIGALDGDVVDHGPSLGLGVRVGLARRRSAEAVAGAAVGVVKSLP